MKSIVKTVAKVVLGVGLAAGVCLPAKAQLYGFSTPPGPATGDQIAVYPVTNAWTPTNGTFQIAPSNIVVLNSLVRLLPTARTNGLGFSVQQYCTTNPTTGGNVIYNFAPIVSGRDRQFILSSNSSSYLSSVTFPYQPTNGNYLWTNFPGSTFNLCTWFALTSITNAGSNTITIPWSGWVQRQE